MYYTSLMHMINSGKYFLNNFNSFSLFEMSILYNLTEQIHALEIFHHIMYFMIVHINTIKFDYIRMVKIF